MISLPMKALKRGGSPIRIIYLLCRHRRHYLSLLMQSYPAIPKHLQRQTKAIFVCYPKERRDLKMIDDENDMLTDDELVVAKEFFMEVKACMSIYTKRISRWI